MKKIIITLLSLAAVLFSSCNPINQASTEQTTKEGYGSITLNFTQKSRTISPYTVDFSQCQWEITITDLVTNQNVKDPSYNPTSNPKNITKKLSQGVTKYELEDIPNGLYSVKAESQFYPISGSAESVTLYAEETVPVNGSTTLALTVGFVKTDKGSLSGTVNISTSLGQTDVEAYLYDVYDSSDENRIQLNCVYNEDNATYSISSSSDIVSGYYFLILMAKPYTYEESDTPAAQKKYLEPFYALNIGDNLIEIADTLTTKFTLTAYDNFSTKTFYAKQDAPTDTNYTGIFPSMPANLSTLLFNLTHSEDWLNVNINLLDSSDDTGTTTLSLPVSSICDYINTSNTQINIYKDTSDSPIAQIKKALIDTNRATIATSGADSRITFRFRPDTEKKLILSHERPSLDLLIDDEIALLYEAVEVKEDYINPFNLNIQFAEDFDPSYYSQTPLITAVATDSSKQITSPCGYISFAQTTADGASGSSDTYTYHVSDTESITYQAFSSSDFTSFYLLPIASNTASVYQEIPDFAVQITYDATLETKLISSGTKFKLYDQNLYLKAVCDDSETFKQGTTFVWRLNGTILDNPYVNLTTHPSYTGSYDIISCVAFYGNNIKSSSFSINATDPVNSSIFVYNNNSHFTKISDIDQEDYSLDNDDTCTDPKITFDKNGNLWWFTKASYSGSEWYVLHGTNQLTLDFDSDVSIINISYDSLSDTIYYITSTYNSDTSYYTMHVYKIPGASELDYQLYTNASKPPLYFSYTFNTEINTNVCVASAVDNYVTAITNTNNYYIFTPEDYSTPRIISLNLPEELSNTTYSDMMINENYENSYVLVSEFKTDDSYDVFISRGGLITLPLEVDNLTTISKSINEIIGWTNNEYSYTNSSNVDELVTVISPDQSETDSTSVFFNPRQFIAIREDELIFADSGFYVGDESGENSFYTVHTVKRIIKYNLKAKTEANAISVASTEAKFDSPISGTAFNWD